jgi:hypothetical protein
MFVLITSFKMAETRERTTTGLCIIVSNYSAVVCMYTVMILICAGFTEDSLLNPEALLYAVPLPVQCSALMLVTATPGC